MQRPTHGPVHLLPGCGGLAILLLLAGCNGRTVMAPASAPAADAKPALATPPPSVMTPQGY